MVLNIIFLQSVAVVLLDGVFSSVDTHNFVHVVSLHPGSECTLFGCYKNYTSGRPSFYTMDPAHCIVGNLFVHILSCEHNKSFYR